LTRFRFFQNKGLQTTPIEINQTITRVIASHESHRARIHNVMLARFSTNHFALRLYTFQFSHTTSRRGGPRHGALIKPAPTVSFDGYMFHPRPCRQCTTRVETEEEAFPDPSLPPPSSASAIRHRFSPVVADHSPTVANS
jgi:hypothetical protein